MIEHATMTPDKEVEERTGGTLTTVQMHQGSKERLKAYQSWIRKVTRELTHLSFSTGYS